MKRSKCLLFILATVILFWHNGSQASETPVWEQPVSIELKKQDLSQALEAVAGQLGINLSFHGKKPKAKRDISLSQVPMGEAVSRIMRLYRIQNHVAAYNPESKTFMLAVLKSSTMAASLPQELSNEKGWDIYQPLSPEEMRQLEPDTSSTASGQLTLAELQQLEPDKENFGAPLTKEEMQQLEPEDQKSTPLTKDELKMLENNEGEGGFGPGPTTLTREELLSLEEDGPGQ